VFEDDSLSDEEKSQHTIRWHLTFWEDWSLRVLRNKYVRFLLGKILDGNKEYCGVEGYVVPVYSDPDVAEINNGALELFHYYSRVMSSELTVRLTEYCGNKITSS
jgi:hypothetical protein